MHVKKQPADTNICYYNTWFNQEIRPTRKQGLLERSVPGWLIWVGAWDRYLIPDDQVIEVKTSSPQKIKFFYTTWKHGRVEVEFSDSQIRSLKRVMVVGYAENVTGGCTITTAVLVHSPVAEKSILQILREYRREWLDSFWFGKVLSGWYEQWSPPIANWLQNQQGVSRLLFKVFIQPCAVALESSKEWPPLTALLVKVSVMLLYIAGTLTAKALFVLNR